MNEEIISKILTQIDKEMEMENWHILLFLDNATSHKECFMSSLTNIKLIFLSKNTMPKVKSLYAAIIRAFKSKYYKMFISLTDEKKKTTEIAEGIDILKATGCLKNAWKPVREKTRQKLFQKLRLSET